jgi:type VI secretion system secreted protein Hcp
VADDLRDYFLKIDGIEGEAQDKIHGKEVRLLDFSFSVSSRADRSQHATGKMVVEDASFSAAIDQAYPLLMKALTQNKIIAKVVLTCRKAGKTQEDFLTATLRKVYVSDCRLEGTTTVPTMVFKMGFADVTFDYREQSDRGILGGALSAMLAVRNVV